MSARLLTTLAAAMVFAIPAAAADDPLADLLQKLHTEEVQFEGNINDIPLFELFQKLSTKHKLMFVFNEELFRRREHKRHQGQEAEPGRDAALGPYCASVYHHDSQ